MISNPPFGVPGDDDARATLLAERNHWHSEALRMEAELDGLRERAVELKLTVEEMVPALMHLERMNERLRAQVPDATVRGYIRHLAEFFEDYTPAWHAEAMAVRTWLDDTELFP